MSATDALSETAPLDLRLSEDELARARDRAVEFVVETVDDAGADGAVIGLSGGIDSTTVAHLAVEALGADRVRGVVMPSEVNREENMSDAERVAERLGIRYDLVDISPVVDAFLDAIPEVDEDADAELVTGNVRVRTRAVLAYAIANAEDRIVLGTGNRSEAMTGYFTKYGDQAVDCNPIGDLYKMQVRQLAADLGVAEEIITKPPSAGMWEGQTDEGEMGLSYDRLDAILALHVDGPLSKHATAEALDGVAVDHVELVEELHDRSAHKRRMPPAPDLV